MAMQCGVESIGTLYTLRQIQMLLSGWGADRGDVPDRRRRTRLVYIPPEGRTQPGITQALITYGPRNGEGTRLYGLRFVP